MLNTPQGDCPKTEIYLDNNATTRVLPQVMEAVNEAMNSCYGNPSSSHIAGIKAKHIIETTRTLAREVIGAYNGELIFTSGATEGIQTAIMSSLLEIRKNHDDCRQRFLLYGDTEHKAVPNTLAYWNEVLGINAKIIAIPVDSRGILDENFIAQHIADSVMICTMGVNNETGVFQDLAKLERVIRDNNPSVLWMVDCVQVLGKSELNISDTSIDYAPFSGHKLYTPKGIGLLYVRKGAPCVPFIAGGGQENGMRSGTENTPGIAALGKVFSLLLDEQDDTFKSSAQLHAYRSQLAETLSLVFPDIVFNHDFSCSVPTTINFSVKGLSSKEVMDLFDAASIRVSSGSACSSKVSRSFVLDAMGAQSWQSESAIRLSFGPATTQAEMDANCEAIKRIIPALHNSCLILSDARQNDDTQLKTGFTELKFGDCCCWLYIDMSQHECVIIDPLPELIDRISLWVECHQLSVKAVFDTHVHYDHTPCHVALKDILIAQVPTRLRPTDSHGWPVEVDGHVDINNQVQLPYITVGDIKVAVIKTPGHTAESLSALFIDGDDKVIFVLLGDLIMPGGFGRTDVHGSNYLAFYQSLKAVNQLITPQTLLGCSHDYQHKFVTSLHSECNDNPLLAQVLDDKINADEFKQAKAKIDAELESVQSHYLCGLVQVNADAEPFSLAADHIIAFLANNPNATVLDVRESYECEAGDIQSQLNLDQPAVNVPLTKLADFAINGQYQHSGPLLLVCRTGNRSLLACKSLIRLGYDKVYNIKGGLALFSG